MRQVSSSTPARLALALVLGALASTAGAQQTAAQSEPKAEPKAEAKTEKRARAEVAAPIIDFGSLAYGESRTHDFVVRNTGDDTLRIHAANSNCACTVVEFTKEIAPGAEGKITARFDAVTSSGPLAVPIDAITNDPDSPKLRLTVKANVEYYVNAVPGYTRYLIVQDFEGDSLLANTLWSLDDHPIRITKVDSPYDFVEATFREARAEEMDKAALDKQQWRVETRISPKAPVGALTGDLVIHVDHPSQKIVKLPLHGFVRPMFAVTPPVADYGDITLGAEGYETSLYVKCFAEETVKLTSAETDVKGITAAIEEAEAGPIWFVKLKFAPDLPKGKFSGVVRIKTGSPKKPLIEVPLKGTIL